MASSRASSSSQTLSLLNDLTRSFDFLPQDLTKSMGDLRELDAVLRTSIQAVTDKIYKLIDLMHSPTATPAARCRLLIEIADEASRLRVGSDDKIRVASTTADEVIVHNQYNQQIFSLLSALDPAFQTAQYIRRTTYPHVAPSNLLAPTGDSALYVNGRRKRIPTANAAIYAPGVQIGRGGAGSALSAPMTTTSSADKSKKRRLEVEEDLGPRRTPKGKEKDRAAAEKEKERELAESRDRHRNKKARTANQRSPSPSDDRDPHALSRNGQIPPRQSGNRNLDQYGQPVNHHQPPPPQAYPNHGTNGYAVQPPAPSNHHSQHHSSKSHHPHREHTSLHHHAATGYSANGSHHAQPPPPQHLVQNNRSSVKPSGTSSLLDVVANRPLGGGPPPNNEYRGTFDDDDYHQVPDHRSHHVVPRPYASRTSTANGGGPLSAQENTPSRGPGGMARSEGAATGDGADGDDRAYCYCERVSFGEMIGCDDDHCRREWFHLSCLDMTAPPKGEWFCDECRARREKEHKAASKKPNRSRARVPTGNGTGMNGNGVPNGHHGRTSVPPPPRRGI